MSFCTYSDGGLLVWPSCRTPSIKQPNLRLLVTIIIICANLYHKYKLSPNNKRLCYLKPEFFLSGLKVNYQIYSVILNTPKWSKITQMFLTSDWFCVLCWLVSWLASIPSLRVNNPRKISRVGSARVDIERCQDILQDDSRSTSDVSWGAHKRAWP